MPDRRMIKSLQAQEHERAVAEIIERIESLHDPDQGIIDLVKLIDASGHWEPFRQRIHWVLAARRTLAERIAMVGDELVAYGRMMAGKKPH